MFLYDVYGISERKQDKFTSAVLTCQSFPIVRELEKKKAHTLFLKSQKSWVFRSFSPSVVLNTEVLHTQEQPETETALHVIMQIDSERKS